jgi:ectoine hydroxylase-related dioxygenase (phytanoyl-CoA dioxygenase family)
MSSSSCICVDKTSPRSSWDYPEYREGDSDETLLQTFQKNGYFVVRGLITQQEISQSLEAISDIVKRWFAKLKDGGEEGNDWDEVANRLPELQGQAIGDDDLANELTIRRLFRMAIHEQYFTEFCRHPKIVSMITKLLGPDIKLLQSMSLLKPPGSGQKTWHQDNAYFRLTPAVVTVRYTTPTIHHVVCHHYRECGLL